MNRWKCPIELSLCVLILTALTAAALGPEGLQTIRDLRVENRFGVGPNTGEENDGIRCPIDVWWDAKGRKLHARSLVLTEVGDPVDLRLRRAPGKYPDGPLEGTSPAGNISGLVCWDALTTSGFRQVAGIEGMSKDSPAAAPTPGCHPGWLTFWTYPEDYDDRVRRIIIDDTGAMSLGGGGFGGNGLPTPNYGFHLFGGGIRIEAVQAPETPKLSLVGSGSDKEYVYQIVARDSKGHVSPPSPAAKIMGPAQLDSRNHIQMTWPQVPGAETYYFLRNGEKLDVTFRGEGTTKTFNDQGLRSKPYEPARRNESGDAEVDGMVTAKQGLSTPGMCSVAVPADQNDFDPPGLDGCSGLALAAEKPARISGIHAIADGRWLFLFNSGKEPITLANEGQASQPANRLLFGTGRDYILKPEQIALLIYIRERWRIPNLGE